jgi:hypothetical protein
LLTGQSCLLAAAAHVLRALLLLEKNVEGDAHVQVGSMMAVAWHVFFFFF